MTAREDIMAEFAAEHAPDDHVPSDERGYEYRARTLAAAVERAAKLKDWRDAEVSALAAKFDARIAQADSEAEHERAMIEAGLRRMLDAGDKPSVKVPSMTAYLTVKRVPVLPDDVDGLVALSERVGVAVPLVPKPDRGAVLKALDVVETDNGGVCVVTSDGEALPLLVEEKTTLTVRGK